MRYCFDIDGTLCTNTNGVYADAVPHGERIALVNQLYQEGNEIFVYTARGATTGKNWRVLTERQLHEWGVMYHELRTDKPSYDIIVDDKAINAAEFFDDGIEG